MAGLDTLSKLVAIRQSRLQSDAMEAKLNEQADITAAARGAYTPLNQIGVTPVTPANPEQPVTNPTPPVSTAGQPEAAVAKATAVAKKGGTFDRQKFLDTLRQEGHVDASANYEKQFALNDYQIAKAQADRMDVVTRGIRKGIQLYKAGDKDSAITEINTGRKDGTMVVDIKDDPAHKGNALVTTQDGHTQSINVDQYNRALTSSTIQFQTDAALARLRATSGDSMTPAKMKGRILQRMVINEKNGHDRFFGFDPTEKTIGRQMMQDVRLGDLMKIVMNSPSAMQSFLNSPYENSVSIAQGLVTTEASSHARAVFDNPQSTAEQKQSAIIDTIGGGELALKDGKPEFGTNSNYPGKHFVHVKNYHGKKDTWAEVPAWMVQ